MSAQSTGRKPLKAKDYASDQVVRWCPGCGDYAILSQFQAALAELAIPRENIAIISGIGCSSRLPYYMHTFGMHSIHGRATAIATGLKIMRQELSVWVVTGDGDGLSIGGNHMIHILRRNLDINILLFNNQIYGLTKGQYSPSSQLGQVTKSSPLGSADHPLNPISFALGCGGTFIARAMDRDTKHLKQMIISSARHKGTAFLEIYQNCNIFNDGAFSLFTDKDTKADSTIFLEEGQPLVFGKENQYGIVLDGYRPKRVHLNTGEYTKDDLWIHDSADTFKAHLLAEFFEVPSEMNDRSLPRPFGVFYRTVRPCYEDTLNDNISACRAKRKKESLSALLTGKDAWEVGKE